MVNNKKGGLLDKIKKVEKQKKMQTNPIAANATDKKKKEKLKETINAQKTNNNNSKKVSEKQEKKVEKKSENVEKKKVEKIDDIFENVKTEIKENRKIEKLKKKEEAKQAAASSSTSADDLFESNEDFASQNKRQGKKTIDGLIVYQADELKIGRGGNTDLCPFE